MVSLRGLQPTSTVSGSSASSNSTATSSSGTSPSTATNSVASTEPSSNFTSVTTKKETTSSGEVTTTVTTTTTTVSTSASTSANTASNTVNSSGVTSSSNAASEGNTGSVSTTTVTTTENGEGSSPVTTVTTDNGVNTTTTSTTKDATTGLTTVTTTTKTDSDMNGSASSSRTWTTTSGGSLTSANTAETSTTDTQESTGTAGASTSTSTGTTSSSTGATMEGASTSTTTSNGSSTGATSSIATGGNSASSGATVNGATATSTTTTGSTNGEANSVTRTASSRAGTSSTSTSVTTSTSSSTGKSTSSGNSATSTTITRGSLTGPTNGANSATASTATTTSSSTNGATESSITTTTSSTGSQSTATSDSSKTSSSSTEATTVSATASSSGFTANSATGSTNGSSSNVSSSSSSSTSSSSSSSSLVSWFLSNFRNDETQLVVGSRSSNTTTGASHQVCNGLPALVIRSDSETPNGGCPEEMTALNASCTCITGYEETDSSWAFHVMTESWNSTTTTTTRATTQTSSDELAINTIRPIWVSSGLETLEIEGAGDSPAAITFIDENRVASSSSLTLVRSTSNSTNISTLSIYNIDLNSVAKKNSDFVPATVKNLTLRNCNISTLSSSFTREWGWIQYLDLSSNNIDTEYVGGTELKELNMSHNALAVFPAATLNSSSLEALHIQSNDIEDFNVSQAQFKQIQGLSAFTADQPSSASTCESGAWQSAHGTTFCVLGASTAAAPDSAQSSGSDSDGDHGGLGLLGYWLIAGAIIVFFLLLLVIWQRRRHNSERDSSPIVSPEAVEPTTPKYNADAAFGDALNRDAAAAGPAAAGAKAVGSGAYPGYGRSHGNSVDSEDTALGVSLASNPVLAACRLDYGEVTLGRCISRGGFGLVFVGSYRGRQVAVKKIRNERDVEREQVEQFVREISLISGLQHPRIVEFIGACWTTPAELSAVTELMERGDLRDVTRRFKRRGYRLTWEAHKTVIALHIAEALTYLHGLSPTVIHRDLKAKNVMLNADMEAKLSDFGIARERSFYDGSEHMTVGIGTSFWIAPEVLLGRDYDERADIYSFGVVLSEIDTDDYPYWNAQHPPQGKMQENEILRLVARGAKRPAFSDDCPPAILELAARCLRADPGERPSASEIVVYLQQLVQDRNSSASFSSMGVRPGSLFDFNTRSTNNSSPSRTAPANTIVNLRSSGKAQQSQAMAVHSSAAAAYAAGRRTKKTTTTTTTTTTASSSAGASGSRPTAAEALAPAHEVVVPSPQVTHQVVRTKLPSKGKRTTTTTTTTTSRRAEQGGTSGTTTGHFITSVAAGSSDGDSSGRSFGSESVPSSQSHAGLPYAGPTSPASLRANHQAALDNLNQHRQLSSSSGSAVGIDRRGERWVVYQYEDLKEL